ncbi:protoglobin domain-containing protein [Polyangium sp. 6x1]|uniref:protoglobin domain-containing protein n=1 Tax=Polyangium sp. 6x1 TaxID=3042689 RepID=UPI0024823A92|nr:protoglobin domain-containing protein [Polyangium sp. 6x1]MDI1447580.1 protoglobin domain-containing protein [Polyangium sp. 6x1]
MDRLASPRTETDESLVKELLRYVRFGEDDARLLRALRPRAAPHFERIATAFYDRIREHDDAHDVFTGEAQIKRLQGSMVRWMDRLCEGPHDEAYFKKTLEIGRIHVQIGLPQRYMFTAMALIRVALLRVVDDTMGADASACREALDRILDIELAVMLESYRDHFVARTQRRERLERAEVDLALRRTEHRYVSAVELARVLVVGLDREARIRLFNREAERVTGLGREEVFGARFHEALLPEALHDEQAGLLQALLESREGRTSIDDVESAVRTRAGKIRDVRWQFAYAPGDDDDIVFFAVGRDTTDENALAARLRQNEKLAAVGTLAAGLAHEIRNPLNGAQLHVTFLERGLRKSGADGEQLEAVHIVGEEIKRLGKLVSEFLDFARPKPLELRPTSMRAVCERAGKLVEARALQTGVTLALELPTSELVLDLDTPKIQQVLLNLLQNAVEALEPTRGGSVTLRARRRPRDVVIEVEDDGPGLASPDAPIFDPFFSTKPEGTGLGLAIVHRIVTDHGGTIDVDSHPGRTVFRVSLPLRLGAHDEGGNGGKILP